MNCDDAGDDEEPEDGMAERLRTWTQAEGISVEEIASVVNESKPWVYDFFAHEIDVEMCDLDKIFKVLDFVGMGIGAFLNIEDQGLDYDRDCIARVPEYIANRNLSLEEFEDEAGWVMQDYLSGEFQLEKFCILMIEDVSEVVGLDWKQVIHALYRKYKG